ncbi:hypothetical protein DFQ26_000426 [Actinomortierella ambigua]|nr:hypothetical protein DFQ26_000426 [Actinomortierella ambigua]
MSAATITVPCKYKTGRTLGQGTYAVVKEAVHIETGKRYAVKVINKKLMEGKEHMIRNEIAVLRRISVGHANILTLVDYFETLNNLYLVTELAEGGELFDRICRKGNYYERDAAQLVLTICSAVAYLHDEGIVHRDLKPENLLFKTAAEDSELLIADFGLSRIIDQDKFHLLTTTCGTPGYMAPEIFQKTGHGKPVDMWALGVITYFLLCGYTPFDREDSQDEMHAIMSAEYRFAPNEYWQGVSETAKSFVRGLLTIDPKQRMTAQQALHHPWLAQVAPMSAGAGGQAAVRNASSGHLAGSGGTSMEVDGGDHDLLPSMKARMGARSKFRRAVDAVKAMNSMQKHADLRRQHPEEVSHVLQRPEDVNMV